MATDKSYVCPRCGYKTLQKNDMRRHLYSKKRICPSIRLKIDLTDEVKQDIMDNHVYHPPKQTTKPNNCKKAKISQAMRIVVWNTYIGEEVGKAKCPCCKTTHITQHNFHCGHVVAEAEGGLIHVDNLRPICSVCNSSMGTIDMKTFAYDNFSVEL